jgi:hypothetical protein
MNETYRKQFANLYDHVESIKWLLEQIDNELQGLQSRVMSPDGDGWYET